MTFLRIVILLSVLVLSRVLARTRFPLLLDTLCAAAFGAPPRELLYWPPETLRRLRDMERAMPQSRFDETRAAARLPNLDIEIVHSRSPAGDAERISISVLAVPSLEAFGRYLEAANPFLFWMRFAQTAWSPWLGAFPPGPRKDRGRLLPASDSAQPDSQPEREHNG